MNDENTWDYKEAVKDLFEIFARESRRFEEADRRMWAARDHEKALRQQGSMFLQADA